MKKALFAVMISAVLLALPLCARAAKTPAESVAEQAGVEELENEFVSGEELRGTQSVNLFEKLLQIIKLSFSDAGGFAAGFARLLAALVFCGLMSALGGTGSAEKTWSWFSLLLLSAAAYSAVYSLCVYVTAHMEELNLAVSSFLPVSASLYALGGNPGAAAASGNALLLFLTVLQTVCTRVILPLVRVCFALGLASAFPGGADVSPFGNAIKSAASAVLAFLFAMLGFALYANTAVAASADSLAYRGIRFASGAFIPVIGGSLGEASRTAIAAVSAVKGIAGAASATAVLAAVIPPVAAAFLHRIAFSLCAAAANSLGCTAEGRFLSALSGLTGVLTALAAGAGTVCLIAIAVFMRTAV